MIKTKDCKAQTIKISGVNAGILGLENKIAYLPDAGTFIEALKKKFDILVVTSDYFELLGRLKKQDFKINYYASARDKAPRIRTYDIFDNTIPMRPLV